MGCTGCNCSSRKAPDEHHGGDYASLWTQAEPDSARELLVVNQKDCPVNLSLTQYGLVVVKRKPGEACRDLVATLFKALARSVTASSSLTSEAEAGFILAGRRSDVPNPANTASASSTRTIPYICLLAATCDGAASSSSIPTDGTTRTDKLAGSAVQITVSALVPRNRGQPDGPLKLWTLRAHVPPDRENRSLDLNEAGPAQTTMELDHAAKAERWCRMAEENAYAGSKRRPKLHCVVNPAGGKGKAKAVWTEEGILALDTGPPQSATNASAIASKHPSDTYDALVAFSGDGIVHELLNGLANHRSGKGRKVLKETPIVHVPCGSGNALATSLLGPEKVGDVRWAALAALKDLGTEHLRWMGDARFTYGYIKGAMERRTYPLHLDVDIVSSSRSDIGKRHNTAVRAAASENTENVAVDSLAPDEDPDTLPPLRLPGIFEPFSEHTKELRHLPGPEGVEPGRYSIDLSEDGVFFLYGGKVPFVAKDVMMFPAADPNDGLIDLAILTSMGRVEALKAMDGAESGALFSHRSLTYLKVKSYRLNFTPKQGGCISIDGEEVPYEAFQVEVHKGLARVMSLTGRWEGRRRIQGF
ncbi:sphinganine kinase lcb4 [Rhodotorula mucilaginosa]|uniref:Sphinganine kinase lcb4 n=1 Tax=Rhodotorula mucilaginosa TaxID=5537 RepID=A0A9P6W0I6_RHOMI|nr:sphinganine kinase lcb4 [Rhodotorula mucilaginosa]